MPASGFATVGDGVTVTLAPDADGAFKISLSRDGSTVTAQEGNSMLDDPAAIATVVDGMYADLLAAEHERG
ncbi:MAG TPA: hypothetical protein VHB18_13090 [Mycobacteriales bacterium]|jgi:hypothetical protein|nr:hypothetical protein [Mycobacteriales bacterium]